MAADSDRDGEDAEWEFTLEEIAERERARRPENDQSERNVTGGLDHEQPLEPGKISLENAFFVLLGVALVVGLFLAVLLGL